MSPGPGFYATVNWDVDSWVDVVAVEYKSLIRAYDFNGVFRALGGEIDLLDVGCGTAIFPSYLDPVLARDVHIHADLLDGSRASLNRATEVLDGLSHFTVGRSFLARIEDLPALEDARYDVIWAIHSFTTVDLGRMSRTYERLMAALKPQGFLFVYQLAGRSAYQKVHSFYRAAHGGSRYMEFEDSERLLSAAGVRYKVFELGFNHVVPDRADVLEKYLQKVTLDPSVGVGFFEPILRQFRKGDQVVFPQTVNLLVIRGGG